jgi:hypothetical protein
MDDLIRDSAIAFVVLFVASGGLITWYAVHVRRREGRDSPDGIVNRASWQETGDRLARERKHLHRTDKLTSG